MKIRIGELAKMTSCKSESIRYYESQGLLSPARTTSNYRQYNDEDIDRLRFITNCKRVGLGINEIKDILHFLTNPDGETSAIASIVDNQLEHIEKDLENMKRLKNDFIALSKVCACNKRKECSILSNDGVIEGCSSCTEMKNHESLSQIKARKRATLENWLAANKD